MPDDVAGKTAAILRAYLRDNQSSKNITVLAFGIFCNKILFVRLLKKYITNFKLPLGDFAV